MTVLETNIRSLQSLGIEADTYGSLLSPVLLGKLPPELCFIVSRKATDSGLTMDTLLKTFGAELTAQERASPQTARKTLDKGTPPTNICTVLWYT